MSGDNRRGVRWRSGRMFANLASCGTAMYAQDGNALVSAIETSLRASVSEDRGGQVQFELRLTGFRRLRILTADQTITIAMSYLAGSLFARIA
jgi:hypothetical protein